MNNNHSFNCGVENILSLIFTSTTAHLETECSISDNGFALCDSALAFRQSALFTEVPKGLPIAKREAVYEKPRGIFVNASEINAALRSIGSCAWGKVAFNLPVMLSFFFFFFCAWAVFLPFYLKIISLNINQLCRF